MPDAGPKKDIGRPGEAGGSPGRGGIVSRIAALFGGRDDAERQRRRLLKEHARRVQRARPRLYDQRSEAVEAAVGALFHSFYRTLGPARILLRNAAASAVLRSITVERAMSARQKEMLRGLSDEALSGMAQSLGSRELVEAAQKQLKAFGGGFDKTTVERAKRAYRAVLVLVDLVCYDYWSILKRFDSRYPEADFAYVPRFLPLDADYVEGALKDFLEVLSPVEPEMDWAQALDILREFRGTELIGVEAWRGLLRAIGELKKSAALLSVIRVIDGDPTYAPGSRVAEGKLIEPYVSAVRTRVDGVVRRAVEDKRHQSLADLSREVFGDKELPRLDGYTVAASERLLKKSLPGFANAAALGYVKAYLIEVHKTQVKQTVDALLIRGKWRDAAISRGLSDAYRDTLAVLGEVVEFDRKLEDNQELGVKLKAALARVDRAKPQTLVAARQTVEFMDSQAKSYITRAAQGCLAMGQSLRALAEDAGRPEPQLLANWQELRGSKGGEDVRKDIVDLYRRLQAFMQILKLSVGRPATAAPTAADASQPAEDLSP